MDNKSEFYRKEDVTGFVDYVIKKTEENILTIKRQQEEINNLKLEISKLKHSYDKNAMDEANKIIQEAKDNASLIVNDALLKAKSIKEEKEYLERSVELYKRKIKRAMKEQLEIMDDIEIL